MDIDHQRQTKEYVVIGTYPAGTDSLELKGSCHFTSPVAGKFYEVRAVLLDGVGKTSNLIDEETGGYNHFFGEDIFGYE